MAPEGSAVPATMRAWMYHKLGGGPDALELSPSVPVPVPGKGEVLVRVRAVAVNPGDWKVQSGVLRPFMPSKLPFIPGLDVAGEVVALGPGAGGELAVGDNVFGQADVASGGGFAEYAVIPVKAATRRPPEVPVAEAACLVGAAGTALQTLRDSGGVPLGAASGKEGPGGAGPGATPLSILVANSTGGVGHYAVQLAKLAGHHVTATCGQRNMEWVRSLGADEVLDYKTPEGAALRSPSGRKYDIVCDSTMDLNWGKVSPLLTPTGKWLDITPDLSSFARSVLNFLPFVKQRVCPVVCLSVPAADLALLAELSAKGQLKTHIDSKVPFDQAPESWRKTITGPVTGKVVVVL